VDRNLRTCYVVVKRDRLQFNLPHNNRDVTHPNTGSGESWLVAQANVELAVSGIVINLGE